MFRKPFLRATLFVVGLGFFVQITGINAIVYYSPRIFQAMGFEGNFALLGLPALVQVAGLAAVFVSMFLVDRLGRRPILLTGIGIMIIANALLVAVFTVGSDFGGALTALGFLGLLLFTVGFTFGFGALVWVYAGESFPARLRSLGSSAMLTSDLVANVAVAAVFLTLLTRLGGAGTFVVFGLLARGRVRLRVQARPGDEGPPAGRHPALLGERRHLARADAPVEVRRRGRRAQLPRGQREVIMDSYQLGLDIGGSKTQVLLARDGVVVADVRGPSANPASVGSRGGPPAAGRLLTDLSAHRHRPGCDLVGLRRRRRGRHPGAGGPDRRRADRGTARRRGPASSTTPS